MSRTIYHRTSLAPFHTTRWSMVLRVRTQDSALADESLEALCHQYWPPLYAYVRRCGHAPQDAEDLTQGFFARLLEKDWLKRADPENGRLRTFLLTAMKRFCANEWDRHSAAKRGGRIPHADINSEEGERLLAEVSTLPDESAFDRTWGLTVLRATMDRLRAEYAQAGRLSDFECIKPTLTAPRGGVDYATLAKELGALPATARSLVHRLRKRFRELFREEVAATVAVEEEIDDEMRALAAALSHYDDDE